MGIMSRLHWEIFSQPGPESDYVKWPDQEHQGMEKESEACRIKVKEKERVVREKCARLGQRLRNQEGCESR